MARTTYQEQLDRLRADVREMSDLVCDRFRLALEAYEAGDGDLAETVITGDHEINERYLDLEGDCVDLIALQQPVASDLRFIAASFKIITDLERVGDLATNVAGYAAGTGGSRYESVDVVGIGRDAIEMVEDAVAAYEAGDAAATREIDARDDDLDDRCVAASEFVVRDLLEAGRTGDERDADVDDSFDVESVIDDVSRILLTIRDLERVGDHAVNVAARTLYMVENDDELIY